MKQKVEQPLPKAHASAKAREKLRLDGRGVEGGSVGNFAAMIRKSPKAH